MLERLCPSGSTIATRRESKLIKEGIGLEKQSSTRHILLLKIPDISIKGNRFTNSCDAPTLALVKSTSPTVALEIIDIRNARLHPSAS